MLIIVKPIENPNQEFWIWRKEITNKNQGRIYPNTISNVGSGNSVAIYEIDEWGDLIQIAQLIQPDYDKLREYYSQGKEINLNYTYINEFTWLGEKKPYEVDLVYNEYERFCADCSFWDNTNEMDTPNSWIHIMNLHTKKEDLSFSRAGFYNINLDFYNIKIDGGNLWFDDAHFYNTEISLMMIQCGGNDLFSPEISFGSIYAETTKIETLLMSQKLSFNFLCAKTKETTVDLNPAPATFNELCFHKAIIKRLLISHADIDALDCREANFDEIILSNCKLLGLSRVNGNINRLIINNCVNSNVFEIQLESIEELDFSNTINMGKIYFYHFIKIMRKLIKEGYFNDSTKDIGQLLMLKENFRQTGEYQNEDVCHMQYQKAKTQKEKNPLKKFCRYLLEYISGYGTAPFRMLLFIFIIIIMFGTIYHYIPLFSYSGSNTWLEHIYISGITFFAVGYGDIYPLNLMTKIISLIEAFLGVTATSYFLVLLSRKIIR